MKAEKKERKKKHEVSHEGSRLELQLQRLQEQLIPSQQQPISTLHVLAGK